jgi:hypothetical protein
MQWNDAKCTQEHASKKFLIIAPQFVPYPLLKSLFLYCIYVAKGKHYHSPLMVENASIWGVLKALWFFFEWSIKVTYCKKSSMWMHPHLDVHATDWYGLQVGIVIKVM